jgi:prophage regulatory protein
MRKVIRKSELLKGLRLSDTTIWRLEQAGQFPRRFQIGGRVVGWFEDEIEEWLLKKSKGRTAPR